MIKGSEEKVKNLKLGIKEWHYSNCNHKEVRIITCKGKHVRNMCAGCNSTWGITGMQKRINANEIMGTDPIKNLEKQREFLVHQKAQQDLIVKDFDIKPVKVSPSRLKAKKKLLDDLINLLINLRWDCLCAIRDERNKIKRMAIEQKQRKAYYSEISKQISKLEKEEGIK